MRHRFPLRVALQFLRKWRTGEAESSCKAAVMGGNREIALSARTDFQERQIAGSERSDLLRGVAETVGNRSRVYQQSGGGGEFTCTPAAESSEDGRIPRSIAALPEAGNFCLFDTKINISRKKFSSRMKLK